VKTYAEKLKPKKPSQDEEAMAIAAMLFSASVALDQVPSADENVWTKLTGFRSIG
jgi:hypothetical protein